MCLYHLEAKRSLLYRADAEGIPADLSNSYLWPIKGGFAAPELVCPEFQWDFSFFLPGKWTWRWGWPRWRRRWFPKWGQYIWTAGRATGRVRNVRKKVVLLLSHPKWDIHITASRQTEEKKRASHFFIFWWWEQTSFTKGTYLKNTLSFSLSLEFSFSI